jgi:hypothetical protein
VLTITLHGGRDAWRALLRMLTSLVARRRVCPEGSAMHTLSVCVLLSTNDVVFCVLTVVD